MNNLTLAKIAKEAPAAAPRRDAQREGLIDTARFLSFCQSDYGMKPVLAVQGTAHRDAGTVDAKSGRHLVAAVDRHGLGYALLNSHFKDRRAHIGMCAIAPGTSDMLVIDSMPVQRWKGFEPVLESFDAKWNEARVVVSSLTAWSPSAKTLRDMAAAMASQGYLANATLHPTAESLFDNYDGNALKFAVHLIRKMKEGRLPSRTPGTRRVRAIRRPDTLFHAGMVAFDIVKEKAREMGKVSARCSFVLTDSRLVRP